MTSTPFQAVEQTYTVNVGNNFEASSPAEAVGQMISWLQDAAQHAGYRVTTQDGLNIFLDADDLTPEDMFPDITGADDQTQDDAHTTPPAPNALLNRPHERSTSMDPNQTLADAREAAARMDGLDPAGDAEILLGEAVEALQHYRNLDAWLSKGGFAPAAWATAPSA